MSRMDQSCVDTVDSIIVAVRKRPKMVLKESEETDLVRCKASTTVIVYESKTKFDLTPVIEPSVFTFDYVFDETATNIDVYETCCRPLLRYVKSGGGAVVFAFGQTGSGKTYTMLGGSGEPHGLYSFTVKELLEMDTWCTLAISFYEVYGPKLFDLLNGRAEVRMLQDKSRNLHILGLSERVVSDEENLLQLMSEGQLLRASGMTHANERSSRSHAVLEIKMRPQNGEGNTYGRVTFVDLAGSERAADTADTNIRVRREGAEINKSLLALKECIRAMAMRKRHIPFRSSKLTQILRESFLGRCKTCVIANISPCQRHCEDTLNTLRYANRIKEIKKPVAFEIACKIPTPCQNCGLHVFAGDRHVCLHVNVQCMHCRQMMDKQDLVAHFTECKEFPVRCQHCNKHLLRLELARHIRCCPMFPVRCPMCSCKVARSKLESHTSTECVAANVRCRYCTVQLRRKLLVSHERECEMMRIACRFCLRYFCRGLMEKHMAECPKNLQRSGGFLPKRPNSNISIMRFASGDCRIPQEQQCISERGAPVRVKVSRHSSITSSSNGETLAPQVSSGARDGPASVCPYARYGCTQRVSGDNLTEHLSRAVAMHLSLVSAYAEKVEVENAELRRLLATNNRELLDEL